MARFTEQQLIAHREFLEQKVFEIDTKWPQFGRLIDDTIAAAHLLPEGSRVLSIERTQLYGNISLFAPFFQDHVYLSLDASPESAEDRGAYNQWVRDDPRCLRVPSAVRATPENLGQPDASFDYVIIPNLLHHVRDPWSLFAETARVIRPGGGGMIFEPLIRELHQIPDDYARFTPWGFQKTLGDVGLTVTEIRTTGGPFSAIAYCWVQALQYFPDSERERKEEWFFNEHFPQLMRWDKVLTENLVRPHTTFPTAYSILFKK